MYFLMRIKCYSKKLMEKEKLLKTEDVAERWGCTSEHVLSHIERGLQVIPLSSKDYRYSLQDVIEYENYLKSTNSSKAKLDNISKIRQLRVVNSKKYQIV